MSKNRFDRRPNLNMTMTALLLAALGSAGYAQPLTLRSDGIQFPDGTTQTTAAPARVLPLSVFGHLEGSAASSHVGVEFPADEVGSAYLNFVLPPTHEPGDDVFVDVVIHKSPTDPCSVRLNTQGWVFLVHGDPANLLVVNWVIPGVSEPDSTVVLDIPLDGVHGFTFELVGPGLDDPGNAFRFKVSRFGSHATDTCGTMRLVAAQVRY